MVDWLVGIESLPVGLDFGPSVGMLAYVYAWTFVL